MVADSGRCRRRKGGAGDVRRDRELRSKKDEQQEMAALPGVRSGEQNGRTVRRKIPLQGDYGQKRLRGRNNETVELHRAHEQRESGTERENERERER